MGQFYKTTKPTFSDDFVYQPPWEVLNKVAATKQAKFDTTVTEATALNDLLKIKHVDEEIENEKVATEKEYYESEVQGLTKELQAGGDYTKMMPRIRELQKKIMQSREDGNIAKFEKSAAIQQRHLKAIEDAKKQKDGKGDVLGAQARYNTLMEKWKEQGNRSLDDTLAYEELINRPDALDRDKMVEEINKLDPSGKEIIRANPNGKGYILTQDFKNSGVSVSRIRELILKKIRQDPNINSYFEQRDRFGLAPGVYDRKNKKLNIIESIEDIKNKKGDIVDQKVDYYDNELANYVTALDPYAYNQTTDSQKYSSDSTLLALQKEANKDRRRKEDEEKKNRVMSFELGNTSTQGTNKPSMWSAALKANPKSMTYDAGAAANFNTIWNTVSKGAGPTIIKQMPQLKEKMMSGDVRNIQEARAFLFNDKYKTYEDFQNHIGFNKQEVVQTLEKEAKKLKEKGIISREDLYVKQNYNSIENRMKDVYGYYSKGEDAYGFYLEGRTISKVPGFQKFDKKFEQIETDMEGFQENYNKSMKDTYLTDVKSNTTFFPLKQDNTAVSTRVKNVSDAALKQMRDNPDDFVLYKDGMPIEGTDELVKVLEKATYVSGYGGSTGDLIGTFNVAYEDDDNKQHEYFIGTKSSNTSYHAITKMVTEELIKPGDPLYKQYSNVEFAELDKDLKEQSTSRNNKAVKAPVQETISGSNLSIRPAKMKPDEKNEQLYFLEEISTLTGEPQKITKLNIGGNVVSLDNIKKDYPELYEKLNQPRTSKGIYNLLDKLRQSNIAQKTK